ncbi:MAG: site-specific DNA-methyltransferase [Opitutales bacterium]|nr:site-specific DNA-methyltransferase [Opitutales bacterium]
MSENSNLEEYKKQLIDNIEKRVTDQIIEQSNADLLKKLIQNAETETEALNIAALGTTYKRTGFHFDKRLEKISNDIKYKVKNKKLSFVNDKNRPTHELIIGDNYDALQNLLITHKGKIDVIYIDPPYGKDNMGEFAQTNYNNSITRDNLLSMLYSRLQLAKRLLTPEGVIFCSIDDKNQAYVKCLFDEVFGEENFIGLAPRKTRGSATTKGEAELQTICDYLIIFAKQKKEVSLQKKIVGEKKYPYEDQRGKFYIVPLQDNGPHGTREARPNLWYPIYELENGLFTYNEPKVYKQKILPKTHQNKEGRWMWSKKKFDADNKDLYAKDGVIYIKHYYNQDEDQNKYQYEKLWLDDFQNGKGTVLFNSIFSEKNLFANPKPIELIEFCINLIKKRILLFSTSSPAPAQLVKP